MDIGGGTRAMKKEPKANSSTAEKIPRRDAVRSALLGLGSGAVMACAKPKVDPAPAGAKVIKWKAQSHDPAVAADYEPFLKYCANVAELSEGQLTIEPHGPGEVSSIKEMFNALKTGKLDLIVTFPGYADFIPGTSFLTSYPLGLDRPDQWETWYYDLGGLELARRMFAPHGVHFLASVQHDLNIIHSRVPIRTFEDFKGIK